jgi:FkbM family methyltransferase
MRSLRPRPGRWWMLTRLLFRKATFLPPLIGIATNWREVWAARWSREAPPVRLRNGQTVFHSGHGWEVIGLLNEVHHGRIYDQDLGDFDGGVIVDIGANIGVVTMNYLSRYPTAVVQAYEPNPRTYRILERNIAARSLSGRARLWNEAVGRSPGTISLMSEGPSTLFSAYTKADNPVEVVEARLIDFHQVVRRCESYGKPIKVVKIDTEGAEADILEGATDSSLQMVSQFVIEYHDAFVPGARSRCVARLERAGFRCNWRPITSMQGIGMIYAVNRNAS